MLNIECPIKFDYPFLYTPCIANISSMEASKLSSTFSFAKLTCKFLQYFILHHRITLLSGKQHVIIAPPDTKNFKRVMVDLACGQISDGPHRLMVAMRRGQITKKGTRSFAFLCQLTACVHLVHLEPCVVQSCQLLLHHAQS